MEIESISVKSKRNIPMLPKNKEHIFNRKCGTKNTHEEFDKEMSEIFCSFMKMDNLPSEHMGAIYLNNHLYPMTLAAITKTPTAAYDVAMHGLLIGASFIVIGRSSKDEQLPTSGDRLFIEQLMSASLIFGIDILSMIIIDGQKTTRLERQAPKKISAMLKYSTGKHNKSVTPLIEKTELIINKKAMNIFLPEHTEKILMMDGESTSKDIVAQIFNSAYDIAQSTQEHFVIMGFRKKKLECMAMVSKGTNTVTLAAPREIMTHCILTNVDAVIIAHNHPSGILNPSKEDINVLEKLYEISKVYSIEVVDMLILGTNEKNEMIFVSLVDENHVKVV